MTNISIIELLKENNINLSRINSRELLLLFESIGEIQKENNDLFFNKEKCTLVFSENKLTININMSRKIIIYFDYSKIEYKICENNKFNIKEINIIDIPNKYFRYAIERKTSNNEIIEHKGLEVKREYTTGTNVEYFKKIGESFIRKTNKDEENELPVLLVGISKVNEIDEKLLLNKKLVLFKD